MQDISIMIDNTKFNYRVGLMIKKGNQVLIEFSPKIDFTTLPGGRVKIGEDSITALKREMQEEMHYELDEEEIELQGIMENFFEFDNKKYHELYFLYKMNLPEDDNRFPDNLKNYDSEADYYRWIDKSKLTEVNLLPKELISLIDSTKFKHILIKK